MKKIGIVRTIAVTSAITVMMTSTPVMAGNFTILDDKNDELMMIDDANKEEQCDFYEEEECAEFLNDEYEYDESDSDDDMLDSGIIDKEAPKLVDLWFGSASNKVRSIKVTHADTFDFAGLATDNLSGISEINAVFKMVNSDAQISITASSKSYYDNRTKKYYQKGEVHNTYADINVSCPPGTYKLYSVRCKDENHISSSYSSNNLVAPYKDLTIIVTDNSPVKDGLVSELSLGSSTIKGGETLNVTGKLTSKGNPPDYFYAYFVNKESGKSLAIDMRGENGIYNGTMRISEYETPGVYVLDKTYYYSGTSEIYQYGKGSPFYGKAGCTSAPDSFAGLSFTVTNTIVDKEAPILNNLTFSNTTVNVPGHFTCNYDVTDKGSGLDNMEIVLEPLSSAKGRSLYGYWYSSYEGKYCDFDVNQYITTNKYSIDEVKLVDKAGNISVYYSDPSKVSKKNEYVLPTKLRSIVVNVINDDETEDGYAKAVSTSTMRDSLVNDINSSAEGNPIHVDFTGYPILKKEALSAIKGKNKTLLLNTSKVQYELNGKDVTDASKDWNMDAEISYNSNIPWSKVFDANLSSLPQLVFMENGALPGKTKVRVNFTRYQRGSLGHNNSNVYIYGYSDTFDNYSHTVKLNKVLGPIKMTEENNIEFTIASRDYTRYVFSPGPAKADSFVYNRYSVADKFKDVKNTWYTPYVQKAVELGYMSGTGADTFNPLDECTRSQLVQILYNANGAPVTNGSTPFRDVASGKWYTKAVAWAYMNKITAGISASEFGVSQAVTREQVAQFLYNYAKSKGYDVNASINLGKFRDAGEVSGWAMSGMKWANEKGIVNGTGADTLSPKKTASRAELATMIVNYMEKIEGR